jgi:hypothetical protein
VLEFQHVPGTQSDGPARIPIGLLFLRSNHTIFNAVRDLVPRFHIASKNYVQFYFVGWNWRPESESVLEFNENEFDDQIEWLSEIAGRSDFYEGNPSPTFLVTERHFSI